ncbi:MAG TPA: AAA family ATPase [Geminicoccaceae bacterium]|nr:AAA family ATPase [Geminicoccaceae bacterium]
MKIATVGKGGSGKTTIAGTLARLLGRQTGKVLAIDGDTNPNLALVLGLSPEQANAITYTRASVMRSVETADGGRKLELAIPEAELQERYVTKAPDGVELIVMGQPEHGSAGQGCMCASHRGVRGLIAELSGFGEHTVTDMEAGLEHLRRGTAKNVDLMLIVIEPYYRSLEAGARTAKLAEELAIPHIYAVANKVQGPDDLAAIESFCAKHGMRLLGHVPLDDAFALAERAGNAPIDHAPHSPGVEAIRELAGAITMLKAGAPKAPMSRSALSPTVG